VRIVDSQSANQSNDGTTFEIIRGVRPIVIHINGVKVSSKLKVTAEPNQKPPMARFLLKSA
jgi:hypothetical protein